MNDLEVFDAGVKSVLEFGNDDLVPHFIYCGNHYCAALKEIFLVKMRKYGIQSAILTTLFIIRWKLVTKEKVKQAYEGKLKNDEDWEGYEQSIHDDFETFFENLQCPKEVKNEEVLSFFLPKLTEDEMKLIEQNDELHFATYLEHYCGRNPDVDAEEMKKSDSKSKYVHGQCFRTTTRLALEPNFELEKDDKISKKRNGCNIM